MFSQVQFTTDAEVLKLMSQRFRQPFSLMVPLLSTRTGLLMYKVTKLLYFLKIFAIPILKIFLD